MRVSSVCFQASLACIWVHSGMTGEPGDQHNVNVHEDVHLQAACEAKNRHLRGGERKEEEAEKVGRREQRRKQYGTHGLHSVE